MTSKTFHQLHPSTHHYHQLSCKEKKILIVSILFSVHLCCKCVCVLYTYTVMSLSEAHYKSSLSSLTCKKYTLKIHCHVSFFSQHLSRKDNRAIEVCSMCAIFTAHVSSRCLYCHYSLPQNIGRFRSVLSVFACDLLWFGICGWVMGHVDLEFKIHFF